MATLTIRDLDDDVEAALRVRAAGHGRSMGSEVREILRHTLTNQETGGGLGSRIAARFADLDAPATLLDRWSAWRPARRAGPCQHGPHLHQGGVVSMATLIIGDLDDEMMAALRVRAAERGRSVAGEVREILRETVAVQKTSSE